MLFRSRLTIDRMMRAISAAHEEEAGQSRTSEEVRSVARRLLQLSRTLTRQLSEDASLLPASQAALAQSH